MYPASDRDDDVEAAHLHHRLFNRWYVEPALGFGCPAETMPEVGWAGDEVRDGDVEVIAAPIDVLGVNYYTRAVVAADPDLELDLAPVTGCGWEIYPQGLTEILQWLHRSYGFSRYLVTENGAAMNDIADATGRVDDVDRIDYLRSHLLAVHDAIADGVPVEGYFVWSLLDNFEWAYGYSRRFGLDPRRLRHVRSAPRRRAPTGTPRSPAPTPSPERPSECSTPSECVAPHLSVTRHSDGLQHSDGLRRRR